VHYLDNTLKNRAVAWEPQYNLLPVNVTDIQAVRHGLPKPAEAAAEPKAPAPAAAEPGADAKAGDAPPAVRPKARPGRTQPPDDQD
jgi:hypothetical protein